MKWSKNCQKWLDMFINPISFNQCLPKNCSNPISSYTWSKKNIQKPERFARHQTGAPSEKRRNQLIPMLQTCSLFLALVLIWTNLNFFFNLVSLNFGFGLLYLSNQIGCVSPHLIIRLGYAWIRLEKICWDMLMLGYGLCKEHLSWEWPPHELWGYDIKLPKGALLIGSHIPYQMTCHHIHPYTTMSWTWYVYVWVHSIILQRIWRV